MHILQLHNRYRQAGGEDRVVEEEAALLAGSGHTVDRVEVRNGEGLDAALNLAFSVWNPRVSKRVNAAARQAKPDIVHVHNTWFTMSPSGVAAARRRAPVVMTLHNYRLACANGLLYRAEAPCHLCLTGSTMNAVRYRCYRGRVVSSIAAANIAIHRRGGTWPRIVDLFLALNEFGRRIATDMGLPPERIEVKPNFVADPGPRPAPVSESDTVLFVGRLTEEKGLPLLLDAWKKANPRGLRLVVIGDGPLATCLADPPPGVKWAGRLSHEAVLKAMLGARALLFPSQWYEGQPMVLLEALASGLPILGSSHGGVEEIVRSLGAGWALPPDDLDAWIEGIQALDNRTVEQASVRARSIYEGRFTPGIAIEDLVRIYRRAAEVHGAC